MPEISFILLHCYESEFLHICATITADIVMELAKVAVLLNSVSSLNFHTFVCHRCLLCPNCG